MTALWTHEEAQRATGGTSSAPFAVSEITIDSRQAGPGSLFIAIRGENRDGHEYIAAARDAGSAAAMVANDWDGPFPDGLPLLKVPDTFRALYDLAAAARARTQARVVAVTGSVGKTSIKEGLTRTLSLIGPTHATAGNLNNHYGLPLTLARMPRDAAFGVLEIGMNHAGEIEPLSRLARPHVAVISTVAAVHLEFFDSVQGIADAKAEIFAGLGADGIAVLNRDNAYFDHLCMRAEEAGVGSILSFGARADADFRLTAHEPSASGGSHVTVSFGDAALDFDIGAPGEHWARNATAILAAVSALGVDPAAVTQAFADIAPPAGRGAVRDIALPGGGQIRVIDESYNASPASVEAALAVLGAQQTGPGGRRIAVLGDMLELGHDGPKLHAGLVEPLSRLEIDRVHCCGPLMAHLYAALPDHQKGVHAATSADLLPLLMADVRDGDVVTVKGSLGSRMKPLVDALTGLSKPETRAKEG